VLRTFRQASFVLPLENNSVPIIALTVGGDRLDQEVVSLCSPRHASGFSVIAYGTVGMRSPRNEHAELEWTL